MRFVRAFYRHPDVIICMGLAILLGFLVSRIVPILINKYYDGIASEHVGDVGKKASDDTPRAYSIDDLLNNEKFAIVVSDQYNFAFDGSTKSDDRFPVKIYNVKLQSGERIAVKTDVDYASKASDGTLLLTIGAVKKESLPADKLEELQKEFSLDRTDFYVVADYDMENGSKYSINRREKMIELIQPLTFIVIGIASYIILHTLVVNLGIAPPLFPKNR